MYDNGEHYEGDWVRGKRHGKGAYVYADGNSLFGIPYAHLCHIIETLIQAPSMKVPGRTIESTEKAQVGTITAIDIMASG